MLSRLLRARNSIRLRKHHLLPYKATECKTSVGRKLCFKNCRTSLERKFARAGFGRRQVGGRNSRQPAIQPAHSTTLAGSTHVRSGCGHVMLSTTRHRQPPHHRHNRSLIFLFIFFGHLRRHLAKELNQTQKKYK